MKMKLIVTMLICFVSSTLVHAAPPKALPETLQILIKRSIFSREGPHQTGAPGSRVTEAPAATQAPAPIFNGAIYDENEYVAFLEDAQSGQVSIAHVGQVFAQGRIEAITLDGLTIRPAGSTELRHIDIGRTLTGELRCRQPVQAPTAAASSDATPSATSAAPTATPTAGIHPVAAAPAMY